MDYPQDPSIGLVSGKFSDGNPATGVPGSIDPASWANAVTDELLAVIADAGLTPDEEDNTQLLQALNVKLAGMSASETAVWKDRAALLDPACYRFYNSTDDGAGWSVTVPVGETWYMLDAWNTQVTGSTDYDFQRICDVNRAIPLPAGTTVKASASQFACAYIAKPALVTGDARYAAAKGLYFERIARLRTLAHYRHSIAVPAGSTMGANLTSAFPTDFTKGLVVAASVHDVSWVTLYGASSAMNLLNEVSDDHQARFAEAILAPFNRTTFPSIGTRPARVDGVNSGTSIAGWAAVRYVKLPSDW